MIWPNFQKPSGISSQYISFVIYQIYLLVYNTTVNDSFLFHLLVFSGLIQVTQEKYESAWTTKIFKAILGILATTLTNIAREEIYGGMSIWQRSLSTRHTPCKRAEETINEETFTTNTTSRTDTSIVLRMQGIEQSTVDQISGPNH